MKTRIKAVKRLNDIETLSLTLDSRIMAMRWDLIPWCLVFDLNVKDSEAIDASTYRAWLVFTGISELSWPLDKTRLPHGCFSTSEITVADEPDGFSSYSFWGLLPSHSKDGVILTPASKIITITAKDITGVCSVRKVRSDNGFLERKTRINLASDDEMLAELVGAELVGTDPGFIKGKFRWF